MAPSDAPPRAALYARISQDDAGTEKGVGRQLADARQLAQLRGFDVVGEWVENDVSAFAHRPQYEALMEAVAAGGIDVIVVYSTSRLWRNRTQRGAAIDTLGRLGVRIEAVSGPSLDLTSATGRYLADVIAGGDTRESEQKGERVARAAQERAEEGRANGVCPYGWRRIYEHDDRGRVATFHDVADPDAAKIVAELVERVAAGEGMRAIARDLNARGVPTPTERAQEWRHSSIRKLVLRPGNIGKRVHRGEIIGDAEWPPIVDPVTWQAAVDLLESRTGRTDQLQGTTDPAYLLTGKSGAGRCGVCGTELHVKRRKGKRVKGPDKVYTLYVCAGRSGCVGRSLDDVDELVGAVVVERLSHPDAREAFVPPDVDGDAAAQAAAELQQRLDDAADAYASGDITREQLTRITGRLTPQIEAMQTDVRRAASRPSAPPPAFDAVTQADAADEAWDALDLDDRREVLDALGLVVKIMPTRQGPGFEPKDVHFQWGTR